MRYSPRCSSQGHPVCGGRPVALGGVTGVAGQGEIPDLVEVTVLPLPPSAAASTTGSSWNTSTKPGNFTSASFGSDVPASGSAQQWASSPRAGSTSPDGKSTRLHPSHVRNP